MPLCDVCQPADLCPACYARELFSRLPQARSAGQVWAERICRGDVRREPAWPTRAERTLQIARRLVAPLATDPRMIEPLAVACSEGAAAWWQRRPARYRADPPP